MIPCICIMFGETWEYAVVWHGKWKCNDSRCRPALWLQVWFFIFIFLLFASSLNTIKRLLFLYPKILPPPPPRPTHLLSITCVLTLLPLAFYKQPNHRLGFHDTLSAIWQAGVEAAAFSWLRTQQFAQIVEPNRGKTGNRIITVTLSTLIMQTWEREHSNYCWLKHLRC